MKSEWLKNILILSPVVGLAALASYYLYKDTAPTETLVKAQTAQAPIATLKEQISNVKRKQGESLYWNPMKDSELLFDQDSIRTGPESRASIEMGDKSQIELQENSLIVLQGKSDQVQVEFKTGDLSAQGANVQIRIKDSVVTSKDASLDLSTDSQNNTQIVVKKGSATLTGKNQQKLEIDKKQIVKIDDKGQAKAVAVPLVLNSPKDGSTILAPERIASIPFTWTVLDEGLKTQFLQVSSRTDFKEIHFEKEAHQAQKAEVRRGLNYWRVGWKETNGTLKFSEPRSLKLEEDKRLQLESPGNQAVLDLEPGQDTLSFSWTVVGDPRLFMIEVAKDPNFSTLLHQKTTSQKTFDLTGFREGQYHWRVRAFDTENQELGRSSAREFQVRSLIPQFPHLVIPTNGFTWTLNEPLAMEWKPYEKASQYRISISRDAQQKQILVNNSVNATSFTWKWAKPGTYYWGVTGLSADGTTVSQSAIQMFRIEPTVTGPAIVLVSPTDQETVTRDRRDPMDPVIFEWKVDRPIHAGPFTFFISEKSDFSKALKREGIESTKFALRMDKSANYFWRVEWKSPSDSSDRERSLPFALKYRINNNLIAPILLEPLHQAKKQVGRPEPLTLRWKSVEGAAAYRVTIERVTGDTKVPVLSRVVNGLQVTTPALEPGSYLWTVSSVDQQKVEGAPGQQRAFVVELNKELAAPRLRAPLVK